MRLIAVVDERWGLGRANGLLFRLPPDMQRFREATTGGVVILGRRTLQSFPGGRPLKNRTNLILSRSMEAALPAPAQNAVLCASLEALGQALASPLCAGRAVFVIGGAEVYRRLLPCCAEALITHVYADGGADCFLPDLSALPGWSLAQLGERQEYEGLPFAFARYCNAAPQRLC